MDLSGQPTVARASGSAQRRKLRRLRAALRHEQQSIAMALASALHHSADKTTRAQYNAPRGHKNAGTEYYALSDDDEVLARGSRPPCLGEPRGPQEPDQPRTVEQIAVYAPLVQILDAPVPQLVEQLPDVLRFFDLLLPVPEQVIEVPKILLDDVPVRAVLREPQLVGQLVDVPTTLSYAAVLLWQALHGYRQRTVGRTLTFQLLVVVELVEVSPVFSQDSINLLLPSRSLTIQFGQVVLEIFKVFPEDRGQHRYRSRSPSFLIQVEVFKIFSQSRVPQCLLRFLLDKLVTTQQEHNNNKGFFAPFPKIKKVRRSRAPRGRNCLRTRAHGRRRLMKRPWCLRRRRKRRRSVRRTLKWSTWSLMGGGGGASGSQLASCTAGGWPLPMGPRLAIPYDGRRGSSAEGQGDVLGRQWIHLQRQRLGACAVFFFFYVKVNSDPEVVFLALWRVGVHAEWRSVHSRLQFPCLHLEFGQYVMSPLYLAVTVRCLVCGAMLGSTLDTCSASPGWLLEVFTIST